ncbi:hypothetical protein HPB49_009559 [Dermacentor silvarum]|uniref:Uncharacterized protein n=1 Tax=Dermacentor silvarum TaxID=543639 RepID=A0ACB8CWK6_DERSI|nr:hypothetical protein HPB49_009559 [Dermacentor silvarum]
MPVSGPGQGAPWSASRPTESVPLECFLRNEVSTLPVVLVPTDGGSIRLTESEGFQEELRGITEHFLDISEVTRFGKTGILFILKHKLEEHGVHPEDLLCFYKEIRRIHSAANPETVITYGRLNPLRFNKPLKEEFVSVECATKQSKNQTFYRQFLLNPVVKEDVEKRCRKVNGTTPHKMSVLVLGLDSASYLNVERHLPDTVQFVRQTLRAFELHGYNKLDDNSYPNIHAFLTGLNFDEALEYRAQGFYDNLTSRLIWQQYRERGYRTMFLEDWSWYGIFYRFEKGFRRPPVD